MTRSADIIQEWNRLVRDEPQWTTPRIAREVAETFGVRPNDVLNVVASKEGAEGCVS